MKIQQVAHLSTEWHTNQRWCAIHRPYTAEEVIALRGRFPRAYPLAQHGAEKFWLCLQKETINALGVLTGAQAVQAVRAGIKAIYVSGWQVAADGNEAGMYPDESLYPCDATPKLIRRINASLQRSDQIDSIERKSDIDWCIPIIADGEAGFGSIPHAYELTRKMIEAGAAAVHFEDQLTSVKKCGHVGGKVLVPIAEAEQKLVAARLAADVMGVPTVIIGRTDSLDARLLSSDSDERDHPFLTGHRTKEGYYEVSGGLDYAIARALVFAKIADMVWFETQRPDIEEARHFAEAIHNHFPGKLLAYNCSPSFAWKEHFSEKEMRAFSEKLAVLGYRFQFVTLAGFHVLCHSMFRLAKNFVSEGLWAYAQFQEKEKSDESIGYTAGKHHHEVGGTYFDAIRTIVQQ